MNAPSLNQWIETNRQALSEELHWLHSLLENAADEAVVAIDPPGTRSSTLDYLAEHFQLSGFERAVILLCAGMELNPEISRLCSRVQGSNRLDHPTFGLALSVLPDAHWSALSPASPLRYWQLIRISDPGRLTASRLAMDERILHFLLGSGSLDQRLAGTVQPLQQTCSLAPSQEQQVRRLVRCWADNPSPPVIFILGDDAAAAREVVSQACSRLDLHVLLLRANDIPATPDERALLAKLLSREYLLAGAALSIDGENEYPGYPGVFAEQLGCPVMVRCRRPHEMHCRSTVIEVNRPDPEEQRSLWRSALHDQGTVDEADLLLLTAQFNFSSADIANAAESLPTEMVLGAPLKTAPWQICRQQTRGGLEQLAQRITPRAGWEDLILPKGQKAILHDISRQARHRTTVYEAWGFAGKCERGLGISALFTGESGTGKTMAAEVLADDLNLDLYRIDLSSVVSKYIGETEKNLERLFRAAEGSGAILLFDEADALFGKRSDVKDSHGRYANIELAYLLQRMEAYRGLSILTSNMKSALDTAFMRRIRFVVQFPFPDIEQRREIWRRIFPDRLPRTALDNELLARLNVTGGNIRNIAMNAAFLAAERVRPLCMADLAQAARMEYAKLEKPLNEHELKKWP